MNKSGALIPGSFDSITGQQTFAVDGKGSMNFVGVPQSQLANGRAFRILNATFFINSDNSNGTIDRAYPANGMNPEAIGFIIPNQRPNPGDNPGVAVPFPLASLGPGVGLIQTGPTFASSGLNQVAYTIDSSREIVVSFGYTFGIWINDSDDGTPHNVTGTVFAQIQWLDNPSCDCK